MRERTISVFDGHDAFVYSVAYQGEGTPEIKWDGKGWTIYAENAGDDEVIFVSSNASNPPYWIEVEGEDQ